jgi:Gas vesicle protein
MRTDLPLGTQRSTGLVEVLDRVLDKGLLVAGDIRVSLAEVELLTIRIRLIVCSMDKAQDMGLDWWKYDRSLTSGPASASAETAALRREIRQLERQVASLTRARAASPRRRAARSRRR